MPELIYVGLGSNLHHPRKQLTLAVKALRNTPQINVRKVSSFYETHPLGDQSQPNYFNAVIEFCTTFTPFELLDLLQQIELKQGRIRGNERWSARTLDLDLLLFGNKTINTHILQIPHYQMHLRRFVLEPLCEIAPNICLPNGQQCQTLLTNLIAEQN